MNINVGQDKLTLCGIIDQMYQKAVFDKKNTEFIKVLFYALSKIHTLMVGYSWYTSYIRKWVHDHKRKSILRS